MTEIWKDIKGYEGKYQISSHGRVRSLKNSKERILKPHKDTSGYKQVDLLKDGKRKTCSVHRLVANHFIPNPNNLPQVNHKDENKLNNNIENLEWCTQKYNCNYGTRNKRGGKHREKSNNPRARKIRCITTNEIFNSMVEAKEKYNVCHQGISKCCKKERRTAGKHTITGEKLKWEYVEED